MSLENGVVLDTGLVFHSLSVIEQSSKLYIDAVQYVDIAVYGLFR